MTTFKDEDIPLLFAFVFSLFFNVPQILKTYKSKNANDLSLYTIVLRMLCQTSWIIYGLMIEDFLIFALTFQNLCTESILLLFKHIYTTKETTNNAQVGEGRANDKGTSWYNFCL